MAVRLRQIEKRMSETLTDVAAALPADSLTVRQLLERLGEEGLLLACIIVCLPYLIPVSLPGMSTLSGILVALVGWSMATASVPWLPKRLLNQILPADRLRKMLEWSAAKCRGLEHLFKPRMLWLTSGRAMTAINGAVQVYNGFLLVWPSAAPFMNTLPGVAAICLATGILERDGVLVIIGYALTLVSTAYFALVTLAWIFGAAWLGHWFGCFGATTPATVPVTP